MFKRATSREIADALIAGMDYAQLGFSSGTIPESPISDYDPLNQIWYSPDIILCHDLEEIINFANLAAFQLFGRKILGRPSVELVQEYPPELRGNRAEAFQRIIETGIPEHFEKAQRIGEQGRIVLVTGYAFRYSIDRWYGIGAKLSPSST